MKLPLAKWHERRGAVFEELFGFEVPLRYEADDASTGRADTLRLETLRAEVAALREGAALFDRSAWGRLELIGEDRVRFLNGLVTTDVTTLAPGEGEWGFFTDRKGQVLSDVVVYCLEDRLWLELALGGEAALREHLERFVVADRVEVQPLEEMIPLGVLGTGAQSWLESALSSQGQSSDTENVSLETLLPARFSHRRVMIEDSEVHLSRHDRSGVPGYTLWVSASIADLVADGLCQRGGLVPVGFEAFDAVRVAAGIPLWGLDYDNHNLPQEVHVQPDEAAGIAWDKGCYLGQEVIARLHYRGQVSRQLRRLLVHGGTPPERGSVVSFEGREAGVVTSAAPNVDGAAETLCAIALLKRRAFEPGTEVEVEGSGQATVAPLLPSVRASGAG